MNCIKSKLNKNNIDSSCFGAWGHLCHFESANHRWHCSHSCVKIRGWVNSNLFTLFNMLLFFFFSPFSLFYYFFFCLAWLLPNTCNSERMACSLCCYLLLLFISTQFKSYTAQLIIWLWFSSTLHKTLLILGMHQFTNKRNSKRIKYFNNGNALENSTIFNK